MTIGDDIGYWEQPKESASDILKWCSENEDKTKETIDKLLDTKKLKDKKIKKALVMATKMLVDIEKLKEQTLEIMAIKTKHEND